MSTQTRREETPTEPPQLVEMSWDPMTRIVGSLGIYTKIDFKNRRGAEAFSPFHNLPGYSKFIKSKQPRDAHFNTNRIVRTCGSKHTTPSGHCPHIAYSGRAPALGVRL